MGVLDQKPNREIKPEPSLDAVAASGRVLANACHSRAWNAGWYHDLITGAKLDRNVPEMLCLVHSEVSEALEGYRKETMDKHLPDRKSIEVELADAAIRIFDLAAGLGLDIGAAMADKMKFNASRPDHKPENRILPGGKKI